MDNETEEWRKALVERLNDDAWCEIDDTFPDTINIELTLSKRTGRDVAALALHGHPFGFTREDVRLIEWASDNTCTCRNCHAEAGKLRDLAARIAALLPPHA